MYVNKKRFNAHPEVDKALHMVQIGQSSLDGNMLANEFRLQFRTESQNEISPAWIYGPVNLVALLSKSSMNKNKMSGRISYRYTLSQRIKSHSVEYTANKKEGLDDTIIV
jgi:hypothetical protein